MPFLFAPLLVNDLNPGFFKIPQDIFYLPGRAIIYLVYIFHPIPEMKNQISVIIQIGFVNILI